jgi:hypothetical protein
MGKFIKRDEELNDLLILYVVVRVTSAMRLRMRTCSVYGENKVYRTSLLKNSLK